MRDVGLIELIDTQWDVNMDKEGTLIIFDEELIDTQWDVNTEEYFWCDGEMFELIDTQWDVNLNKNPEVVTACGN